MDAMGWHSDDDDDSTDRLGPIRDKHGENIPDARDGRVEGEPFRQEEDVLFARLSARHRVRMTTGHLRSSTLRRGCPVGDAGARGRTVTQTWMDGWDRVARYSFRRIASCIIGVFQFASSRFQALKLISRGGVRTLDHASTPQIPQNPHCVLIGCGVIDSIAIVAHLSV